MENIHDITDQDTTNQDEKSDGKKKIKLWLWVLFGAVLVALITSAVFFIVLPSLYSYQKVDTMPQPLMYSVNDEVFIILGDESIALGEVDILYPDKGPYNGVLFENRYLYYLVNVSRRSGEGTLMKLDLLGSKKPVEVADDVCTGQFSSDHKKMLYLTNMKEGAGTLYLLNFKTGQEEKIAKNVIPSPTCYGLSKNGDHIYYVCQNSQDNMYLYELYMKSKGEDSYKVNECIGENYSNLFFNIKCLNSGVLIHKISSYRYDDVVNNKPNNFYISEPNGDTSLIADGGSSYVIFNNSFTYYLENEMFYVDEEKEEVKISDKYGFASMAFDVNGEFMQDRFLLGETDDPEEEVFTMYEQFLDGERIEIGQTNSSFPIKNKGFTFIAFIKDRSLFVSSKNEDNWTDPEKIGLRVSLFQLNSDESALYYIVRNNTYLDDGTLYKYDLATGENQELQENVDSFMLYGNTVYTKNADELFWVKNADEKIEVMNEVYQTYEGLDGIYIMQETSNYDIYYLPYEDTEPVLLYEDIDACSNVCGFIDYKMPVPTEAKEGLKVLYHDAKILLELFYEGESSETMWLHYTESYKVADNLRYRPDIEGELQAIFSLYCYGYSYLVDYIDYDGDITVTDYLVKCEENISKAIEDYEDYLSNNPDF